ncbi:MAG: hypothetical protein NXH95_13595 [Pseudomonadaceae bacterium]|nr:hypothetical protein [Pseudomonadaceae bacterium]
MLSVPETCAYTDYGICQIVINETEKLFGIRDLVKYYRTSRAVEARHTAMYLCRQYTELPLHEVGYIFGRDHTTVYHGERRIKERLEAGGRYCSIYNRLKSRIDQEIES